MSEGKPSVIMIVEDESILLQAINKKLNNKGFETISCVSGSQALDYLNELPELPDAIWLDYYLKDMNGLEFMHTIKSQEKTKSIPVVIVSNSASADKVRALLGLGAEKYLLKAENRLEDIVEVIKTLVQEQAN